MNIDSLVNNAFFLSTSQRNPYKGVSTIRQKQGAMDNSIKLFATKNLEFTSKNKPVHELSSNSPISKFENN